MGNKTETMAGVIHLFLVTKMITARMGTTKTTTTTTTTTTTVAGVFYNVCVVSRQESMIKATKKTSRRWRFC
jgi:hypothetical protein